MKFSISVPDDLWTAVHTPAAGPSDTVQRGLRALLEQRQSEARPMANAPHQDDLERYSAAFEDSVASAASSFTAALDNGYRFGLLIASGLEGVDFDDLDDPRANATLRSIVLDWGGRHDGSVFSFEFAATIHHVLNQGYLEKDDEPLSLKVTQILGAQDEGGGESGVGVQWIRNPDDSMLGPAGQVVPRLSETFAEGALAALRDVRDEALRRVRGIK